MRKKEERNPHIWAAGWSSILVSLEQSLNQLSNFQNARKLIFFLSNNCSSCNLQPFGTWIYWFIVMLGHFLDPILISAVLFSCVVRNPIYTKHTCLIRIGTVFNYGSKKKVHGNCVCHTWLSPKLWKISHISMFLTECWMGTLKIPIYYTIYTIHWIQKRWWLLQVMTRLPKT